MSIDKSSTWYGQGQPSPIVFINMCSAFLRGFNINLYNYEYFLFACTSSKCLLINICYMLVFSSLFFFVFYLGNACFDGCLVDLASVEG